MRNFNFIKLFFLSAQLAMAGDWVTRATLSSPTNFLTRWAGAQIGIYTGNITVTGLSRLCLAGNSGTHIAYIIDSSLTPVVGPVTINMTGCTTNSTVTVAASGTLTAGANYYIFGAELNGGDNWTSNPAVQIRNSAAMMQQGFYDTVDVPPTLPMAGHFALDNTIKSLSLYSFAYTLGSASLLSFSPTTIFATQANMTLRLYGANTNWVQGNTALTFSGSGFTVNSLMIDSAESATAVISTSGAAISSRDITMTTGGEVVTFTGGMTTVANVTPGSCSSMVLGNNSLQGSDYGGFKLFGASSATYADITNAPADPNASAYVTSLLQGAGSRRLRSVYAPIDSLFGFVEGLPYTILDNTTPQQAVFIFGSSESDPGPYPIPTPVLVSGTQNPIGTFDYNATGDKQALIIDNKKCIAYEFDEFNYTNPAAMTANTVAVWDLLAQEHQRPTTWTSNGVSGMARLPLLITGEELQAGVIGHAIGITAYMGIFDLSWAGMASHSQCCGNWDKNMAPFGSKIRLNAAFDVSPYPAQAQLILNTLKQYGGVLLDGGGIIDLDGSTDTRWNQMSTADLFSIFGFTASNFTVVTTGTAYCFFGINCGQNAPSGAIPVISGLTATSTTVGPGQTTTVAWSKSNVPHRVSFLTPEIGAVVTDNATFSPFTSGTYSVVAQNEFGRSAPATIALTQTATTYISVKFPALAATANLTITAPSGATVSVTGCAGTGGTAVVCPVNANPTVPGQKLTISYFTAGAALINRSGAITIN